jgi:hypothetical protein
MKSQVSFVFENINKDLIVESLNNKLKGFKYRIEKNGDYTSRIFVASTQSEMETFHECYLIQCFCVYDDNRDL